MKHIVTLHQELFMNTVEMKPWFECVVLKIPLLTWSYWSPVLKLKLI